MASCVNKKLSQALKQLEPSLAALVEDQVLAEDFAGQFSAAQTAGLLEQSGLPIGQLMQQLLPIAAAYAQVPISEFPVGVWIQGSSGALYAGANQEFVGQSLGQTVHAEQAGLAHAWQGGETALRNLAVTAAPCGHCRQFLNELNQVEQLTVHCLGEPPRRFAELLPHSFGPAELNEPTRLLSHPARTLTLSGEDPLLQQVRQAAEHSYAPYTGDLAACGLELEDGQVFVGRYAENAAYNPSFLPMQGALLALRWRGISPSQIRRALLVETRGATSQQYDVSLALLSSALASKPAVKLEYAQAERV